MVTLLLLGMFAAIAGHGITGYWRGVLIDQRNKISLARLQMVLWTLVALSAFLTAVLANIRLGQTNPTAIALPEELWLLLGISTTSLVGSSLVKVSKQSSVPDAAQRATTFADLGKQGVNASQLTSDGVIVKNQTTDQARWADLFQGEETGNAAHLDLAKIQMFYFTFVLVLTYCVALGALLQANGAISEFPAFDASVLALLGISHAGYLASKAAPHSSTQ
jgi:hypothetical protein